MAAYMKHVKFVSRNVSQIHQIYRRDYSSVFPTNAVNAPLKNVLFHSNCCKGFLHKTGKEVHPLIGVAGIRFESTNVPSAEVGQYIPEPPSIPTDITPAADDLAQLTLNALGEPTFVSLGLGGWWPSGLVQSGLEMLHVGLDLPWWSAIVVGTLALRCCVFPLVIKSQKNAANLHNNMPTMTRLQERFTQARMSGNPIEAAKAGNELMDFMKRNNINPIKNFLVPMAQMPIFISVFLGIRKMTNLPVESMKEGGLFWFNDLTIADPFYVLPAISMLTFLITIEVGVDGVKATSSTVIMKYFMRAMPFILFPFIMNFPSAMLCYWCTTNVFSLLQVMFLRLPRIRTFFGIEQLVKHEASALPQKKNFMQGVRETYNNSKVMAQVDERSRIDQERFRKAGVGPIQKTYSYDPTKVQAKKK